MNTYSMLWHAVLVYSLSRSPSMYGQDQCTRIMCQAMLVYSLGLSLLALHGQEQCTRIMCQALLVYSFGLTLLALHGQEQFIDIE